jgi:sarcosine oxidase subunit beta
VRRLGRHVTEIPLSLRALEIWRDLPALVGDECGFTACDQIQIAETEAEMDALRDRIGALRGMGYAHETLIDRDELRDRAPALAPHCVGAILCEGDGAANPFRAVQAFRRRAIDHGVDLREQTPVAEFRRLKGVWRVAAGRETIAAAVLVNCAGAWGAEVADRLGDAVPLSAEAFMLMITERVAPFLDPVLGAKGRPLSFKQFANGTVLIGGGYKGRAFADAGQAETALPALAKSARTVAELFPDLRRARVVRAWAGLEGVTPDDIPVIGPSIASEAAYHAFGFCGHGFQLAPAVGEVLARLILDGDGAFDLTPFRADRFMESRCR